MIRRKITVVVVIAFIIALIGTAISANNLTGYVTANSLYVRDQPSTKAESVHLIMSGEIVTILHREDNWYNVVCANGKRGYVSAEFIRLMESSSSSEASKSGSKTTATSSVLIVPTSSNTKTTSFGDRGENVKEIQQALSTAGYYKGSIDGIFGQGTAQAVKKFQKDNALVADGIVGKATTNVLFGGNATSNSQSASTSGNTKQSSSQSAKDNNNTVASANSSGSSQSSKSQAKSLDWYSEGKSLVSKNKNMTIKDLKTGVTWNARYINGSRHADIIPASAADAKKIASNNIEGSYVRRPVIATIAGVDYAGSMYAVAHGETNYCDYFNGVMCIHFTGSETHGSQKVDADHQKAITTALGAKY